MNLITDEGKYYLYRHIRLDKNEVFYVGIGTKTKSSHSSQTYKRAKHKNKRNPFWQNITSKTKWTVEIILESNEYDFIKEKEKEFIALYGRRDLGNGTLCNLTDGGDGISNQIKVGTPVYMYDKNGVYVKDFCSQAETGRYLNCAQGLIFRGLHGEVRSIKTYFVRLFNAEKIEVPPKTSKSASTHKRILDYARAIRDNTNWKEKHSLNIKRAYKKKKEYYETLSEEGRRQYDLQFKKRYKKRLRKVIKCTQDGTELCCYYSIADASREDNVCTAVIRNDCNKKVKTKRKFIWKYYENS